MKLTKIETPPRTRIDTSVGTRVFAGDQMIYGDTGWRDFKQLTTDVATSRADFRRVGNQVHISIRIPTLSSTSWTPFPSGSLPSGFRHRQYVTDCSITVSTNEGKAVGVLRTLSGGTGLRYDSGTSTGELSVYMTYISSDPWPTTLPGTPA